MDFRLDKTAISVISLDDEGDDRLFWQTKTPLERLEALEYLRQIVYGYDPATARVERVIQVAQLDEI